MNTPFGGTDPQQPQYGQPPPNYPAPGTPGYGAPATSGSALAGPEPREVTVSFWLWVAAAVLGVIGVIVAFTQLGPVIDQIVAAAGPAADAETISTAATIGAVGAGIVQIVIVGLQLLFAFFMRRGRNWARIVLTVFGVIGVVLTVATLAGGTSTEINGQQIETSSPLVTGLSVLQLVLVVVAIVMFFRPAANAYFGGRR